MKLSWTTRIAILLALIAALVVYLSLEPNLNDPNIETQIVQGVVSQVNSYPSNPDVWIELEDDFHRYIVKNGRKGDINQSLLDLHSQSVIITSVIHFNLMDPSGNLQYVKEIKLQMDSSLVFSVP